MTNSDVHFLVLARPADSLSALASSILPRQSTRVFCNSVYDLIPAIQEIGAEQSFIVITRPSMLAKPHLTTALHRYPNLRLIGWLGSEEKVSDSAASVVSHCEMVLVSTPDQLASVITAFRDTLSPQIAVTSEQPKADTGLDSADYRLSNEELDALLGAG